MNRDDRSKIETLVAVDPFAKPRVPFKRVQDRTIKEALHIVRQYQDLIVNGRLEKDENGNLIQKKYHVKDAAIMIGISKRSLDDYLY